MLKERKLGDKRPMDELRDTEIAKPRLLMKLAVEQDDMEPPDDLSVKQQLRGPGSTLNMAVDG